ncbi:MAG: hypothetical protein M1814_001068 [Vezdaea aestivalis]|nr:MAG: hypothetical protein M1814_001068 [Vezdaea aestivalis]
MLRFTAGGKTPQSQNILPADIEKALNKFCTPVVSKNGAKQSISVEDFRNITGLLKALESNEGVEGWSWRPRTYTVLRNIGRLDLMPHFVAFGFSDIAFPFTRERLSIVTTDSGFQDAFLKFQKVVFTKASELEKGPNSEHVSFTKAPEDHFQVVKQLGSGGSGYVDHIWSRLSFKEYARKRFRFGRDYGGTIRTFENEVQTLKRLSHHHLVQVMGSYTDPKCVAFLMRPVADCNLLIYLRHTEDDLFSGDYSRLPTLRSFFGCLANALNYLHQRKIRHRDLKPENILIKDGLIFIADFSAALDWSHTNHSTTLSAVVAKTPYYMAPEVAKHEPRSSASDMWSIGVVFLEMTTVLRGKRIHDMRSFLKRKGSGNLHVWNNIEGAHAWFEVLRCSVIRVDSDNEPLSWIKGLLQIPPLNRPRPKQLIDLIRESSSSSSFLGFCCASTQLPTDLETASSISASSEQLDQPDLVILNDINLWNATAFLPLPASRRNAIEGWLGINSESHAEFEDARLFPTPSEDVLEADSQRSWGQSASMEPPKDLNVSESQDISLYQIIDDESGSDSVPSDPFDIEDDTSTWFTSKSKQSDMTITPKRWRGKPSTLSGQTSDIKSSYPFMNNAPQPLRPQQLPLLPSPLVSVKGKEHITGPQTRHEQISDHNTQRNSLTEKASGKEKAVTGKTSQMEEVVSGKNPQKENAISVARIQRPKHHISSPIPIIQIHHVPETAPTRPKRAKEPSTRLVPDQMGDVLVRQGRGPKETSTNKSSAPNTNAALSKSNIEKFQKELIANDKIKQQQQLPATDAVPQNPVQGDVPISSLQRAKFERQAHGRPKLELPVHIKRGSLPSAPKLLSPEISIQSYMQQVWEAESSAPTSVLSESTKKKWAQRKPALKWQDKSYDILSHYAAEGKSSVVKICLEAGCNPGTKEKRRTRPLYQAIIGRSERHLKCVRLLLIHGADVNMLFRDGKTPLHVAIEQAVHPSYNKLIHELLEAGADPNIRDKNGDFPLLQILYGGYDLLPQHHRAALALLLRADNSVDVNVLPPGTQNMPLHLAIRRKDPWAVGMLLRSGANITQPNGAGLTPLLLAAHSWTAVASNRKEQVQVLEQLLDFKADLKETGGDLDNTALHLAVSESREDVMNLLLDHGADCYKKNKKGDSPLALAIRAAKNIDPKLHSRIMSSLCTPMKIDCPFSADQCSYKTAVKDGDLQTAGLLLKHGADANLFNKQQNCPLLHTAIFKGNENMVSLLLKHGARPEEKNASGRDAYDHALSTHCSGIHSILTKYKSKS